MLRSTESEAGGSSLHDSYALATLNLETLPHHHLLQQCLELLSFCDSSTQRRRNIAGDTCAELAISSRLVWDCFRICCWSRQNPKPKPQSLNLKLESALGAARTRILAAERGRSSAHACGMWRVFFAILRTRLGSRASDSQALGFPGASSVKPSDALCLPGWAFYCILNAVARNHPKPKTGRPPSPNLPKLSKTKNIFNDNITNMF